MKKKEESLCISCSNYVRIKYQGTEWEWDKTKWTAERIKGGVELLGCYFSFTVYAVEEQRFRESKSIYEGHKSINIGHLIIQECSFYNKLLDSKLIKGKVKIEEVNDNDDDENRNGVTFVNDAGDAFL